MWYLEVTYLIPHQNGFNKEYVGPFPHPRMASWFGQTVGPTSAEVVRLEENPERWQTPGQYVDSNLERWASFM